eukprot:CAMPEP_0178997206 /NCGR_PEP_ID=MMETSP0795-20121207/8797_1 /TAXON_ID=88552 /ORGANISM="Amoebophrya sp., Strain Ameob2" /LENGTH=144 /DNA_ID=CAMNT_0020689685 /DNA_START=219 /DNA_END=653 /DNA_ORIENTATION=-
MTKTCEELQARIAELEERLAERTQQLEDEQEHSAKVEQALVEFAGNMQKLQELHETAVTAHKGEVERLTNLLMMKELELKSGGGGAAGTSGREKENVDGDNYIAKEVELVPPMALPEIGFGDAVNGDTTDTKTKTGAPATGLKT